MRIDKLDNRLDETKTKK